MKTYQAILTGIAIAAAFALGFLLCKKTTKIPTIERVSIKTDTLIIRDTITSRVPKYITKTVIDSIYIPVPVESNGKTDTLYTPLPLEQIVWQDSLSRIYASGYKPQIDSVLHFTSSMIINTEITNTIETKKKTKWSIGIQAGVGAQYNIIHKTVDMGPYIGVGISYNIASW